MSLKSYSISARTFWYPLVLYRIIVSEIPKEICWVIFFPNFEIFFSAQKGCKCTYNLFALKWKVHCFYINFSKIWNNSWFRQNPGVILFQIMCLDHRHPLMQKSYFGQNVTYNLFALRWRIIPNALYIWAALWVNKRSGFRPCLTQTRLCSHRRWLEAWNFRFRKKRDGTINEVKTKALIRFVVTAKLICIFVFAYAKCWFSNDAAHIPFSTHHKKLVGLFDA